MPRSKAVDPPVLVKYYLPTSKKFKLDALLYSEEAGKIPHGAVSKFHEALIDRALANISKEELEELYGIRK